MVGGKHSLDSDPLFRRLEKNYLSLKRWCLLSLAFSASLLLLGLTSQNSRTLKAESFILLDRDGDVRAKLSVEKDTPALGLYDKKGKPRVDMGLAPDGAPVICLYDEAGLGRVLLEKGIGDSWSLSFYNEHGKSQAYFGVDSTGKPSVRLVNKDDAVIWSTP
jgi:hypothetical protein